jgi:hypothetical protein
MGFWAGSFAAHGILLSLVTHRSTIRANSSSNEKCLFFRYLDLISGICITPT